MDSDPTSSAKPSDTDPVALERLQRFGGPKLLGDMITLFLEAIPQRLAAARDGLERGDAHAVEHSLHALKSSAAQLGALRMHRLCQEGEQLARGGTLEGVPPIIDSLDTEHGRVHEWLTSARPAHGA